MFKIRNYFACLLVINSTPLYVLLIIHHYWYDYAHLEFLQSRSSSTQIQRLNFLSHFKFKDNSDIQRVVIGYGSHWNSEEYSLHSATLSGLYLVLLQGLHSLYYLHTTKPKQKHNELT